MFGWLCAFFMCVLESARFVFGESADAHQSGFFRSVSPHTDGVLGVVTASLPRLGITSYQAFSK